MKLFARFALNHLISGVMLLNMVLFLGACNSSDFTGSGQKDKGRNSEDAEGNSDNAEEGGSSANEADGADRGEGECDDGASPCGPQSGGKDTISVGANKVCTKNIDIVFSIDVSTSMNFTLFQLHDDIAAVWRSAEQKGYAARFGFVGFVDDAIQPKVGAYASISELQTAFVTWARHTATNANTSANSINLDLQENSLDALALSAEEYPWRDGQTTRIIFHATDAEFFEAPRVFASGLRVKNTYMQTAKMLVQKKIRLASFIATGVPALTRGFTSNFQNQEGLVTQTKGKAYDLSQVAARTLSMAQAINDFVVEASCK